MNHLKSVKQDISAIIESLENGDEPAWDIHDVDNWQSMLDCIENHEKENKK